MENLYTPNSEKLSFIDSSLKKRWVFQDGPIVLGEEFNCIVDNVKDRSHKRSFDKH